MANLNNKMISQIKKKIEFQQKLNEKCRSNKSRKELVEQGKKVVYSNEELDFVIQNYYKNSSNNELSDEQVKGIDMLGGCIFLLNAYKQTNQPSKCNAIYNFLNKYFQIVNKHDDDLKKWKGFEFYQYIDCPFILQEMVDKKARMVKLEQADKTDKEMIEQLEL